MLRVMEKIGSSAIPRAVGADALPHVSANVRLISDASILVVEHYKHLGSSTAMNGNPVPEARARAKATMASFVSSMESALFSPAISARQKLTLASCLSLSELLSGVHVLSLFSHQPGAILNIGHDAIHLRLDKLSRFIKYAIENPAARLAFKLTPLMLLLARGD